VTERDPAKLIWSLSNSGIGTTISGSGNSGSWSDTNPTPNALTALDLRFTDDLALYVYVTGVGSSPTFKVSIDGYDDLGNLFPALAATANITGTGAAAPVYIGRHGGGSTSFVVLPQWARVSWTCTGGSVSGVEIAIWGR
jgi:hypothetical protein